MLLTVSRREKRSKKEAEDDFRLLLLFLHLFHSYIPSFFLPRSSSGIVLHRVSGKPPYRTMTNFYTGESQLGLDLNKL